MGRFALAALLLTIAPSESPAMAPLYDPVALNIGINCQWQQHCQQRQHKAMRDVGRFIAARHPPVWKIHLCNRNARRGPARVDWVGFNDCVRNSRVGRTPSHQR
ncbi:MAG TPA: hypothetical protein VH392_02005 [Sphingomicrobium sp.]|jgi:hypothetical protein